jgi:hypothetical protein
LDRIQREYDRLASTDRSQWKSVQSERKSRMTSGLKDRARKILADMDDRGAWVERGELKYHKDASQVREIIDPKTFRKNLETLAEFLAASSSGN